jgi:transcriptional regulator with XRE-family HTH domain
MASKITNDRKRSEMKEIMEGVFAKGWKPAEVAAVIGVTPSNISSWKAGKNMGTNDARAALAALPGRDTGFAKEMMEKVVEKALSQLVKAQRRCNAEASEAGYQKRLNERMESNLHSIEYHSRELPNARDEWSKTYHTDGLAEARAKTQDDLVADAKRDQVNGVTWYGKEVTKAAKHLKNMEKVLAKW